MREILSIFLLLVVCNAHAQFDTLDGRFINYDLKNGLVTSSIRCITQDLDGFIYGGTSDGLFQYDGIRFRQLEEATGEFSGIGVVNGLVYDSIFNSVYVGTDMGMFVYAIDSDSLTLLDLDYVRDVQLYDEDIYYLKWRSPEVLNKYDVSKKEFTQVIYDTIHTTAHYDFTIHADNENIVYLGYLKLQEYNRENSTFRDLLDIEDIRIDDVKFRNNKVYAATIGDGVFEVDLATLEVENFTYSSQENDRYNMVRHLSFLNDSIISVSTSDRGIGTLNLHSGKFSFYVYNPLDQSSISLVSGRSTFIDSEGNLWAAMAESLSLMAAENNHFKKSVQNYSGSRGINTYDSYSINDEFIIQGTNRGLFSYSNQAEPIELKWNVQDSEVSLLNFRDYDEKTWAAGPKGIYLINDKTKTVEPIIAKAQIDKDMGRNVGNVVCSVFINDTIYINSLGSLFAYSYPDLNFLGELNFKSSNMISMTSFEDRLFILTHDGVFERIRLDSFVKHDEFLGYFFETPAEIQTMESYQDGLLLGSISFGLIRYDLKKNSVFNLCKKTGVKTNQIYRGEVDEYGNIWGASSAGLVLYNKAFETISTFDKRDNIISNDLIPDRINNIGNGYLGISAESSIGSWNPSLMKLDLPADSIQLVQVNGDRIFSEKYPAGTSNLAIQFSTFDYGSLGFSEYEYQLNSQDWEALSTPGELNLLALSSGNYDLQLKVIDKFGRVGYSQKFSFKIATPWQRTWWFLLLLGLAIAVAAYLIFNRINREKIKSAKVKEEFDGLRKDLENQVLRSQMNPHFLFNSMNSIRYFILSNETQLAANYLTKFSRLIRKILENSRKESITLNEEIKTLDLYVDLEKIRFDNKFVFEKEIKLKTDSLNLLIPPMIIQPYLENAIIHGINAKEGKSILRLEIEELENELKITIIDDGIGRKVAHNLKKNSTLKKESLGQEITKKRLQLISENLNFNIQITDMYPGREYTGTKVELILPLK